MANEASKGLSVAATPAFKAWILSAAESIGCSESALVERGLRLLAERNGLEPPPERAGRPGRRPMPA